MEMRIWPLLSPLVAKQHPMSPGRYLLRITLQRCTTMWDAQVSETLSQRRVSWWGLQAALHHSQSWLWPPMYGTMPPQLTLPCDCLQSQRAYSRFRVGGWLWFWGCCWVQNCLQQCLGMHPNQRSLVARNYKLSWQEQDGINWIGSVSPAWMAFWIYEGLFCVRCCAQCWVTPVYRRHMVPSIRWDRYPLITQVIMAMVSWRSSYTLIEGATRVCETGTDMAPWGLK